MKKIMSILAISVIIFACSKKEPKEETFSENRATSTEEPVDSIPKNCTYTYNDSTTTFGWKAYKTNEKIGVGGTFDDIQVTASTRSSMLETLNSISFIIQTQSVNSNNEERDIKLFNFFFNKMIGTDKISGRVKSIAGSDASGNATFEIIMNEMTQDVTLAYTTVDEILNFSGDLNMDNFNGQEAVKILNKECEALHTGGDGLSVLWPTISLTISTQLTMKCD